MSARLIAVRKHGLWTELKLNSPPRNILSIPLLAELCGHLDRLCEEGSPPILLSSGGRHFSTGYDIAEISADIFSRDPVVRSATSFEMVMARLSRYPAPVLAAVQGDAYGGAVELLACVDIRIAAPAVRIGVPAVRLGLVYSPSGIGRLLRSLGSPLAREMLLLGEPITAERAVTAGFFCRTASPAELETAAAAMMASVCRGGPAALRGTRRVLQALEEQETLADEVLLEIAQLREASRGGEEFARAQAAFIAGHQSPFGES